jgi:hypothetical protein
MRLIQIRMFDEINGICVNLREYISEELSDKNWISLCKFDKLN